MVRVDEYVKHRVLGLCAFFVGEKIYGNDYLSDLR